MSESNEQKIAVPKDYVKQTLSTVKRIGRKMYGYKNSSGEFFASENYWDDWLFCAYSTNEEKPNIDKVTFNKDRAFLSLK